MKKKLYTAIQAAIEAGEEIINIYKKDFTVDFKDNKSPLTEADRKADQIINNILGNDLPIISEESKALPFEDRKSWTRCWLVDPLDGTKEFIKKNDEFTVNIALIDDNLPVLGVVYLPVFRQLYIGAKDIGSYLVQVDDLNKDFSLDEIFSKGIKLNDVAPPQKFTIVASRSHMSAETEEFIAECRTKYGDVELISKGSSIKLCLVAEGKAHVYPRIAPTMEWDTGAAHAVAKYAGCEVLDFYSKKELTYNKENLLNPFFIVKR